MRRFMTSSFYFSVSFFSDSAASYCVGPGAGFPVCGLSRLFLNFFFFWFMGLDSKYVGRDHCGGFFLIMSFSDDEDHDGEYFGERDYLLLLLNSTLVEFSVFFFFSLPHCGL